MVGDNILRAVVDTLRADVRAGDLIGRLGGQQVAILIPGPGKFDALAIAERIRCRVAATTVSVASPDTQSQFVGVTVSIGVTAHPHGGTTLGPLLEAANSALCAKAAGRNRAVGSAVAVAKKSSHRDGVQFFAQVGRSEDIWVAGAPDRRSQ